VVGAPSLSCDDAPLIPGVGLSLDSNVWHFCNHTSKLTIITFQVLVHTSWCAAEASQVVGEIVAHLKAMNPETQMHMEPQRKRSFAEVCYMPCVLSFLPFRSASRLTNCNMQCRACIVITRHIHPPCCASLSPLLQRKDQYMLFRCLKRSSRFPHAMPRGRSHKTTFRYVSAQGRVSRATLLLWTTLVVCRSLSAANLRTAVWSAFKFRQAWI
jgi:hypothetical protein